MSKTSSLQEFTDDIIWLMKSRTKLIAKYEDEWVAVWKTTIIDHDENLDALIKRLRVKGYKPEHMVVEFLSKKPIEAILWEPKAIYRNKLHEQTTVTYPKQ